ncbi:HTTM domain-containing protein [Paradesertivirga mongoliensis]|uniref:HTTM domain-containing protein n=1 Tax=Paradesertivirga mongoliensis TaxID=2100740 RepID=A0ABW4ZQM3_9SPHI|nr:HTTM domain-containing protein [Pedobacter mongoliensis]
MKKYLEQPVHIAPLALFRIMFGAVMFISVLRFWLMGWIAELYINPSFHFTFYGFEFIRPLGIYTYLIFLICALSALGLMLGLKYRISAILFFLSFSYIELMDKAYYLNHYYFIAIVGFLLIWLPAGNFCSLDTRFNYTKTYTHVPRWCVGSIRFMLCLVYFYAGLAKLNTDWLVHALPLKIWLPSKYDLPLIGGLVDEIWMAYLFSWFGALYDLTIWIFLLYKKTRKFAFPVVIIFHVCTSIFFPAIGMFPYIMIIGSLIFFDEKMALNLLKWFDKKKETQSILLEKKLATLSYILIPFFLFQVLFPLRFLLYPGKLFWTEQGYRFSWRVMLMEKAGIATFTVKDLKSSQQRIINNGNYLNATQEKQMSFQPDMIVQFANFLGNEFKKQGFQEPAVFVECYATLNARSNQLLIDPKVDLYGKEDGFKHKGWITQFNHEIKGF